MLTNEEIKTIIRISKARDQDGFSAEDYNKSCRKANVDCAVMIKLKDWLELRRMASIFRQSQTWRCHLAHEKAVEARVKKTNKALKKAKISAVVG